ncbi:MAG: winged helix-turn-helix domain-containing protein [Acidobacteriota bacterium]|nr:winged helix-turn-helix domain-containing protein [Acidobacteriota bacterium]
MQKQTHQIYSFDEFTLDLTRGCLLHQTEEIKLRPKSFEVLTYLIENGGRLITKDELIKVVWQGMAVTDDSLVQCLKDIRRALSDEAQEIIKTVTRRGYIFEKEVSENGASAIYTEETAGVHLVIEEMSESSAVADGFLLQEREERKQGKFFNAAKLNKRTAIFALASFVIVVTAFAVWRFYPKQNAENPPPMSVSLFQNVEVRNITHVGNIVNNAISPDGKYAIYTTTDNGRESLWLRQIATDSTQQIIAPTDLRYFGVSFSRDGEYIYYLRADRANPFPRTLYRIPKLGGVSEKVLADMDWCPTFSPDGSQMAFVRNSPDKNDSRLMIAKADGTNERNLAVRSYNEPYTYPAWSPDGQTIAASAGSVELGDSFRDVVTVNISDGVEKTLTTRKWYWINKVAWLADGSGLIMSANPEKSHIYNQLWLLSYPNGEARQITNDSHNYALISLTADSHTLLAGHTELLTHLWIAPEGDAVRARRVSSGLGSHKQIRWTPDGKLAVAAFGNKNIDIYLREADGAEIEQLTVNAGTNWGQEVSPDGRFIVFDSDRTGDFHIWRMDADGGNPVQLTNGNGEKFAEISPDGKWVVYTAYQDWTLWKVSIEGGAPVQIAKNYARQSAISPDGKWIVYMASESNRQVVMPFEGGSPVKIFDLPPDAPLLQPVRWSPDSQSLQFIVKREGVENIWQLPLNGGSPKQITNFTADRIFSYDWSDDGKTLAVIRGAWTADLVLLSQK